MTAYKCVAWVLNSDGVRRPECTEVIPETELSRTFVGSPQWVSPAPGLTSWLAACEFARRMGFEDASWKQPQGIGDVLDQARWVRKRLPIIIRVEEIP